MDSLPNNVLPAAPRISVTVEDSEANSAMDDANAQRLTPARFNIDGVKTVPFEEVANEFSPLANKKIYVRALITAADRVTNIYRGRGYPLSFAFVPAQKFENNVVEVNVVEGYVDKITFTGNAGTSQERLERIAAQLRNVRPLTDQAFQRVTRLLQLEPGIQISASIAPPPNTDGAAEMTIDVKKRAITSAVSVDTATSRVRGVLSVSANDLARMGEQLTLSTLEPQGPSHEKYYALNYTQPIGIDGMTMQLSAYDYKARPSSANLLAQGLETDYDNHATRAALSLGYSFILDSHRNLGASVGVYAAHSTANYAYLNDAAPDISVESKIRALSLEYTWQMTYDARVVQAVGGLYKGLGGLGASAANSNANTQFTRVRGQVALAESYAGNWGTVVSGMFQYSRDILPPSEQISFGGRLFGMGYPANDATGDSGWGLAIEGNRSFVVDKEYLKRVQLYVAVDKSVTLLNTPALPRRKLSSVGVGFRLADLQYYSLDISVAKPIGDHVTNDMDRSLRYGLLFNYKTQ